MSELQCDLDPASSSISALKHNSIFICTFLHFYQYQPAFLIMESIEVIDLGDP